MKTLGILGTGTMGAGIAQIAAQSGYSVLFWNRKAASVDKGVGAVKKGLGRLLQKERISQADHDAALARLRGVDALEDVKAADIVLEAVPEDLETKRELYEKLHGICGADTIFASNTSSLSITSLSAFSGRPANFVGMHFFNPVPAMKLLEIVQGERTHPMVVTAARAVGARLGKEVVVVRDAPGFATSRLGIALAMEAIRMLEEGVASAEEIDRAIELGYGHPMGPLKLTDQVGLDVRLAIAEHLTSELGERFRPPQLLRRMVRAGKLGKKSGEGFYKY
jgi:3-hydroxybutyryl-CoA dehydrogenase